MKLIQGIRNKLLLGNQDKKLPLRSFPSNQTNAPTCIIGNAIPKSGTYLLNSIFKYLNLWSPTNVHLLDSQYFIMHSDKDTSVIREQSNNSLKKILNGQIVAAHLHWNKEIGDYLNEHRNIKHIFMYRDPRDIFVSFKNYMTYSKAAAHWWKPRKEQQFLNSFFNNDDDRLWYLIVEYMKRENWEDYLPWFSHDNTHILKFEDLYLEISLLKKDGFGKCLKGLFEYLEVDIKEHDPEIFYDNVMGKGYTSTGDLDKIERYKKEFKVQHYNLLNTESFKEILRSFGYEWYQP